MEGIRTCIVGGSPLWGARRPAARPKCGDVARGEPTEAPPRSARCTGSHWGIVLRPGAHTAPWWDNDRNLPEARGERRTRTRSLNYKGQPLAAYESNVFWKNHSSLEHPVDPVASMRNTVDQKVPGLWVSSAPTEIPPRRILT